MNNSMIGNQLGKYQLIRLLGQGGMAEVYEAFQPGTERPVAVKVLRGYGNETPESIARFKREARSIAQLRHTNIIQVFDFDVDHNLYYMVMEYIQGGTLSDTIRARGALSSDEALRITIQLADALAYAHRNGVIHRDIKPVNILFADMEHQHPVLTDFGIARIVNETAVTADGRFMGSPAYLSPEVALGHPADARSDIYGLGLTLYEMIAGRMPYNAADATAVVMQHMNAPLPSPRQLNPDIPPAVEIVLSKALAKTRDRRYQSADEFKRVLARLVENLKTTNGQPPDKNGTRQILTDGSNGVSAATLPLDASTLPFDTPVDSRTRTVSFEQPDATEEKPRRRKPLIAFIILLLLLGSSLTMTVDDPTPSQPAVIVPVDTGTSTPTFTATPTATLTETPTLTPTHTATPTPTSTLTLFPDVPPVRENPFFKPTTAPSETPTATATPTNRPRPTQPPGGATQNPGQVANPTAVPPTSAPAQQPTNPPASGGGNPVQDIVEEILPGLPCLLNCG